MNIDELKVAVGRMIEDVQAINYGMRRLADSIQRMKEELLKFERQLSAKRGKGESNGGPKRVDA